jgi:hypothetical protein
MKKLTAKDFALLCPCSEGADFAASQPDLATAWEKCERGDWIWWLARKLGVEKETSVKFAKWCVEDAKKSAEKAAYAARAADAADAARAAARAAADAAAYAAAYAAADAAAYAAADAAARAAYAAADAAAAARKRQAVFLRTILENPFR